MIVENSSLPNLLVLISCGSYFSSASIAIGVSNIFSGAGLGLIALGGYFFYHDFMKESIVVEVNQKRMKIYLD